MNNQKMLDVVTMIANVILPDECDHGSALEIWLRAMKRKAREALESREREAVGNAAAMREALEAINRIDTRGLKRLLCELVEADIFDGGQINKTISAVEKARRALSAPPRNCDKFADAESARQAWLADAENWDDFGSPELDLHEWLLAHAKPEAKGENDGR